MINYTPSDRDYKNATDENCYQNKCGRCAELFLGKKRAFVCKLCWSKFVICPCCNLKVDSLYDDNKCIYCSDTIEANTERDKIKKILRDFFDKHN